MISNQILQNTLDEIKEITKADFAIYNAEGRMILSTKPESAFPSQKEVYSFAFGSEECIRIKTAVLIKTEQQDQSAYILAVTGGDNPYLIAKLSALQIKNLVYAYHERLDKDNFYKNLLLDNMLLVDVYNRAKKFGIPATQKRIVLILKMAKDKEQVTLERIEKYFAGNENDFVTAVDDDGIIVIKHLEENEGYEAAEAISEKLLNVTGTANTNYVAYGTIVNELKDVSRSYKEARMAIDVGKIFSPEKNIVAYSSLGIGRLIYQLPIPLCRMFIKEIFANSSPEKFDEETLTTIYKFFENNLNVSETSRQLYIHRNTLVYRLDKIQKTTGLDLRVFEDAITFKIALMVVRYMKYMETLDY